MDHDAARIRFGERLTMFRRARGLTQEQLAERIGKGVEHQSFLERGQRAPSFETLLDLAAALEIAPAALLNFDAPLDLLTLDTGFIAAPVAADIHPITAVTSAAERATQLQRLHTAFASLQDLQQLAAQYGIADVFLTNGGKLLQVLMLLGLRLAPEYGGHTALDGAGNRYEVRVISHPGGRLMSLPAAERVDQARLDAYRAVAAWYVAIYIGANLSELYQVEPTLLAPLMEKWTQDVARRGVVKNPMIPLKLIRRGQMLLDRP